MRYRNFDVEAWDDEWVEDLPPLHKLLFIYLWTNPKCTAAGIYSITVERMAFHTRIPAEQVEAILPDLMPKVEWDPQRRIVFVKSFFGRQCMNPSFAQSAIAAVEEKHPDYLPKFMLHNRDILQKFGLFREESAPSPHDDSTANPPSPDGADTVGNTVGGTVGGTVGSTVGSTVEDTVGGNSITVDSKTDKAEKPLTAMADSDSKIDPVWREFEELWNAWPVSRRTTTKDAFKAYKAARGRASPQAIRQGVLEYTSSVYVFSRLGVDEGTIKTLPAWLNANRWEEDRSAWAAAYGGNGNRGSPARHRQFATAAQLTEMV